ncbi:hypothetical protein GCM10023116_01580 [Kistimonas scapharcae]|uniref:Uncharacterized protein n=1 Tax=Kistimonas scapharcae TaxID=1036133 RepID=A0ABP8UWH3_9GAMM
MPNLHKVMRSASPEGQYRFCELVQVNDASLNGEAFALKQTTHIDQVFEDIMANNASHFAEIEEVATRIVRIVQNGGYKFLPKQHDEPFVFNPYDRVIKLLLNSDWLVEQAEMRQFASYYRFGKMWDSYRLDSVVEPQKSTLLDNFKLALGKVCRRNLCRVERFTYDREHHRGGHRRLLHLEIFLEGDPSVVNELDQGEELQPTIVFPAHEFALTHEYKSGKIEVVAPTRAMRNLLSEIYVKEVLGLNDAPERITPRSFGLDHLRQRPVFTCQPNDRIDCVHVTGLKCKSLIDGTFWELNVPKEHLFKKDVYDSARDNDLDGHIESEAGFRVVEATIHILKREQGRVAKKTAIPVRFKEPNRHNLREMDEQDRLVVQRMLVDSGIIDEDDQ